MRIYLDGCDGSGKSTLAKYLSERFKIDIFSLTKDSTKSIKRYEELHNIDNVVYDRTFLSEVVYPPIFGRDKWLNSIQIKYLLSLYETNFNDLVVITTAPSSVIKQRIKQRGDEFEEVIENITKINQKYRDIADKYCLMLVNTYVHSNEEIGDLIERRIANDKYNCR